MTVQVAPDMMSHKVLSDAEVTASSSGFDQRAAYLAQLLQASQSVSFNPSINQAIATLQQEAAARLSGLALPSTRDEDWRFTDLSALMEVQFKGPTACFPLPTSIELKPLLLPEVPNRLIFVNGKYDADLSQWADVPEAVTIGNMGVIQNQQLLNHLGQENSKKEVFTTLNTATFQDIAVIWVGKNVTLEVPIHILFISTVGKDPILFQPRCLVVTETNSSLQLIEDYVTLGPGAAYGLAERTYLNNGVTEIYLGENSEVHHTRIQREGATAFHIGSTEAIQARDSRYHNLAIHLGGKLSRHNLTVSHRGEQTETTLQGLALVTQDQLTDTHSAILYDHPHCCSNQLYKAIVDGRGRSVFNGKVVVPKAAQLTDAAQLNRNLLLSPKARVDTKPQMEIIADNVKCTHGATVSQLEDEEIFYLQSRGLDRASAQTLLIDGFAAEILQKLPIRSLRETLTQAVINRTNSSATSS
jgi:Fe-S cluster assembly protein SufD